MENNELKRDIFISYKNDGEGRYFAEKLSNTLKDMGFSVYYNTDEHYAGNFPNRLREAVENCTDFLLVLTQACLDQLKSYEKVDWVREEISIAKENQKNIVPLLMPGVKMPKDKDDMPSELQFLPHENAVAVSDPFDRSPLDCLLGCINSQPTKEDTYKDVINSNDSYNVFADFEETLENAKNGSYKAMYEVANMYYYGFADDNKTSDRDFIKAYQWFKKISETDNEYTAYANSMLGRMHHDGVVPFEKQSYEKSFDYHKKAAEVLKWGYSAGRVSYMQQEGRGCEYDFEAAEKYYLELIKVSDDTIKLNLARFYINHGMFTKAAEIFNMIENNISVAEYNLGMLYKNGNLNSPPKPDYKEAFYHFQNAINCDNPHPDAANQLGHMYFSPVGNFKKDFKIAQKYFEMAAEMGNISSRYMLGYMYEFGYVKKDIPLAIKYFTMSANQGEIYSNHHLAMLYQQNECKNYHKAFKYAKIAAECKDPEGEFILANLLYMGRGCEADKEKAYEYYKLAFEHGMEQAAFMMEKIDELANRNV